MILYKYLAKERYEVLERFLIRFSPPGCLNDLFEANPSITSKPEIEYLRAIPEDRFIELLEFFWDKSPEIQPLIKRELILDLARNPNFREFALSKISEVPQDYAIKKKDDFINSELGILSLSECVDSEIMWAHYASDHQGFAVGFHSEHAFLNSPSGEREEYNKPHKMEYSHERPSCGIATSSFLERFLVKSEAWGHEKEWRIIKLLRLASKELVLPDLPYPVHLFAFPPEAIHSVYLGARIDQALGEKIAGYMRSSAHLTHVKIFRMSPSENTFEVTATEMPNQSLEVTPLAGASSAPQL